MPETNIDEALVPRYTLPELFTTRAGAKVSTAKEWEELRRPELLALFESEVFGHAPPPPDHLDCEVLAEDSNALGGKAVVRRVALSFRLRGEVFAFHATCALPAGRGKVPVFLLLNHRGVSVVGRKTDAPSGIWPVEYGLDRGYAMVALDLSAEVEPDSAKATTGLRAFYRRNAANPQQLTWGTLSAWAWAASRVVDYLLTVPEIDPDRIAIIGHSRGGKTALWAGAQDTRIALVVPNNAGDGGPTIVRRRFGNTIEVMTGRNPHWFTAKYATYAHREETMPIDQHMLVALVAPRGYHGGDGSEDLWHDPRGSWLSLIEASRVWALYGKAKRMEDRMPMVNDILMNGPIAYHMRSGGHGLLLYDWKQYFDHADTLFAPK